ncbi:dihydrofolate reductase family protein [Paenibacillus polymyxa]|uniref:dihydrofolate reductase family protein n=1 Tax=Paenibacillus polymyxa TaxID=1406 RepID=UPI0021E3F717|nr:dihydrofolate reductase family protein [Paenibacillus polymyxa]
MERPKIICHMMASLDGKIIGDFFGEDRTAYFIDQYEKIHTAYGSKAWMIGRISVQEHLGIGEFVAETKDVPNFPRTDYVTNNDADKYIVAVDPSGKIDWKNSHITEGRESSIGDHVIEVLTEKVSDSYLANLQNLGISYIFGGKETLDFKVVVKKLKDLFSIDQILLEGGAVLNGSLLNEGLIDELSLLVLPVVDGSANSKTIFETDSALKNFKSVNFVLDDVEKLENEGLWMKYSVKRD